MNKEFAPYEPSLALKELGFDEPCFGIWMERGDRHDVIYVAKQEDAWMAEENDGILAPLYQQAFRWFREKYDLFCWIEKFHKDETYIFQIPPANFTKIQGHFKTYEEAELACLIKLIEIVKNK
jgi:hypothetical protein